MTAPLSQRIRCLFAGHDWRRAIGPRQGYYLRCRRCWVTEQEEVDAHTHAQPAADLPQPPVETRA